MAGRLVNQSGSFLSDLRSCNGNFSDLLEQEVKPETKKLGRCSEILEYLMLFLQHNTKYSVKEVIKGGSLGKGTSIKAKADIDVAVFLNDFRSVSNLQHDMKSVLRNLHDHITHDATCAKQVEFTKYTSHSIQFKLKTDPAHQLSEVDLLPACDLGQGSRDAIFRQMSHLSSYERSFYSVCLVKDQLHFVNRVPDKVKSLIQLVKHWKRTEDIGIVSYCIELIVIKQWDNWGQPMDLNLKNSFKKVLEVISGLSTLQITWPSEYTLQRYNNNRGRPPVVMDPANPFINTADRITDVDDIEWKAREHLSQL